MSSGRAVDRIDAEILGLLQQNARLSNKELAAKVGLAASSCLERVRRLGEAGFFRGFHAEVDPAHLGIGLEALIAVRLRRHTRNAVDEFREHVVALREVRQVYHVAGQSDYLLHVAVRDAEHLRRLVLDAFTERREVAQIETALIFEHVNKPVAPDYTASTD